MLVAIEELFKNGVISCPQTKFQEELTFLYNKFSKQPWYLQMYQDVQTKQKTAIVVKAKYEIDIDSLPCRYGEYQIRYFWDGYERPTIEEAAEIFRNLHRKDYWFVKVWVSKSGKYLEVLMRNNKYKMSERPDFFRDYPVQYEVEKHWQKAEDGNLYSGIITTAGEDDGTCTDRDCNCNQETKCCSNCPNLNCPMNKNFGGGMDTSNIDIFGVYHKPQEVTTSNQIIITNH